MSGLPGAGKSTLARRLAPRIGAVILESDHLRALLFAAPIHSQRESGILFRAIRAAAESLLADGRTVIIDATNVSESDRKPFYDLADKLVVPLRIVAAQAPESVIMSRLERRASAPGGYAYADAAVYHRIQRRVEPISRPHRLVDTADEREVQAALAAEAAACGGEAEPAEESR